MLRKIVVITALSVPLGMQSLPSVDSYLPSFGEPRANYSVNGGTELQPLKEGEGETYNKASFKLPKVQGDFGCESSEAGEQAESKSVTNGNGLGAYQTTRYFTGSPGGKKTCPYAK